MKSSTANRMPNANNRPGRLGRILVGSIKEELDQIINRLKSNVKILDQTAVATELARAATFRSGKVHKYCQYLAFPNERSEVTSRDCQNLRLRFENWLNPPNMRGVHDIQLRKQLQGTCQWIWTHPTFCQWNNPSAASISDRLLYIYGTHGSGKTILASSIVERLQSQSTRVLFFSFAGTDSCRQTLDHLVRSLLCQLFQLVRSEKCLETMRRLLSQGQPLTSELWDAYDLISTSSIEETSWVIDGLDECKDSVRPLFEHIRNLLATRKITRVLLLGRPHLLPDFDAVGAKIEVVPQITRTDIETFIEDAVAKCDILNQPDLHVVTTLRDKADGMFLWAKLMIDDLSKSSSRSEVMERLRNLPRGLEDAYRLVLTQMVKTLDKFDLRLAHCILNLTVVACRPLLLGELQYAQALASASSQSSSAQLPLHDHLLINPRERILRVCGGLVTISDDVVRLVHFSIKEFLTRTESEWSGDDSIKGLRVAILDSHASFSSICLNYLEIDGYEFPLQDPEIFTSLQARYPFLDYASRYLIHHCNESADSPDSALAKLGPFIETNGFVVWLEYFAIIVIEDGTDGSLMHELGKMSAILERNNQASQFLPRLEARMKEELVNREQRYGASDWRTDQLRLMFDLFDREGHSDQHSSGPALDPASSGALGGTAEMMRLLNGTGLQSVVKQAKLVFILQRHLLMVKTITDPLRLLLRLILQKSASIPVYALLAIGDFYFRLDKYNDALEVYTAALARVNDEDVPIKYLILDYIGEAHQFQSHYEKAEKMYRQAAKGRERLLGAKHARTLETIESLGFVLSRQSKCVEAETMYRRAADGRDQTLGANHKDTLCCMNNLGAVLEALSKNDQAETIYRRVVKGRSKTLGADHRDTLLSTEGLGRALFNQAKYAEAETMYQKVAITRERTLGPGHKETLAIAQYLGNALHYQRKYAEAKMVGQKVATGREKTLGPEHKDTLGSIDRVAASLFMLEEYAEAETMYRRVVEGRHKTLGAEHKDTLASIHSLGDALYYRKKYAEAETMYRQAAAGRDTTLGAEHINTLDSIQSLGDTLYKQVKYSEAKTMYLKAATVGDKTLGPEHEDTLESIGRLGNALYMLGEHDEAETIYRRAVKGNANALGAEHSDTLASVDNLGSVLYAQMKYAEAETMYRRTAIERHKTLGAEHKDTLASIQGVGDALYKQKKYAEAKTIYQQLVTGRTNTLGAEHEATLRSINNLGVVLHILGEYRQAETTHRKAVKGRSKMLGADHRDTLESIENLGRVLNNQAKYLEAEVMHRRTAEGREKTLGSEHEDTLDSIKSLKLVLKNLEYG